MMPELRCRASALLLLLKLDAPAGGADRAFDDLALPRPLGLLARDEVDTVVAILAVLRPVLVLHVLLPRLAALRKRGDRRDQRAEQPTEDRAARRLAVCLSHDGLLPKSTPLEI